MASTRSVSIWKFREDGAGLAQEPGADGFSDLGDFERVREAGAVEIVFAGPEDLGLVLEAAEGGRVEDSVAVDLEGRAVISGIGFSGEAFGIEGAVEFVPHEWECFAFGGDGKNFFPKGGLEEGMVFLKTE